MLSSRSVLSLGASAAALSVFVVACSAAPGTEGTAATDQAVTAPRPVCDPWGRPPAPGYWWSTSLCQWVPADAGECVETQACMAGDHWDPYQCKCIKDCDTQMVLCIAGGAWSTLACRCVSTCAQTVMCIDGDHFDRTLCKCLPGTP